MAMPHAHPRRPGDTPVAALDLTPRECAVLAAARYLFVSFAEPHSHAWIAVVLGSDDFFSGEDHAAVARAVLTLVQEIRRSRRSVLHFSNPRCACCAGMVTAAERHMMLTLRFCAAEDVSAAATNAMLLCEGNGIGAVLDAARRLACLAGIARMDASISG